MSIHELFSKRQKRLRGESTDVYQYEDIPGKFRVQVVHIVEDSIGCDGSGDLASRVYKMIHKVLCREYGVFTLKKHARSDFEAVYDYFLACEDYDQCLDIIEWSFDVIDTYVRENNYQFERYSTAKQKPDDAINELNGRFREAGIGYQFESGEIVRIDSQYVHAEVVKPVLALLGKEKRYSGANSEFLKAHEHYCHKRYKECLVDCLKSFESLMKAICDKHKWSYSQDDTAKKLVSVCLDNNLIPAYLQNQFSSLRALLESGVPTIRNKEGGHGQGTSITDVPEHLVSYALHLTATNLLFLMNCELVVKKG